MSEPRIYTKNYVNADDTITTSNTASAGALPSLYDRDKTTQWITSGANSDATNVTIGIAFYEGTVAVSRTIDTLILINHNLKQYGLQYWNGSSFVQYGGTYLTSTDAAGTTFYTLSPAITTTNLNFQMYTTQTANQEKAIGEIVACALQFNPLTDIDVYSVAYRQKIKSLIMGDGSLQQTIVFWTANRSEKYEASVDFNNLTSAQLTSLAAIKESAVPFLWYPESVQRPDEIWYVHWTNPLTWQYHSLYKGAGIDITMQLKEV